MARRGASSLRHEPEPGSARDQWREAVERAGRPIREENGDEVWIFEGTVEDEPPARPDRGRAPGADRTVPGQTAAKRTKAAGPASRSARGPAGPVAARGKKLPREVVNELAAASGQRSAARVSERMGEAVRAYQRERYAEAARELRSILEVAPGSASAHELLGLSLYRMGRWGQAIKELDSYREITGAVDQHPVLADCHRALGHRAIVAELWDELKEGSPSAALVAEGRIVMAATLADDGKLPEGIELLSRSVARPVRRPEDHHLRQWYALADLYERAGDVARARELFGRVASHDPEFVDVEERIAALR